MTQSQDLKQTIPHTVWPSAQKTAQYQRAGRYLPECSEHPGKMLPDLARRIIEEYSQPGDLVVDPMAGIGTTVVEAASVRRRSIGIELENQWVGIANRNLDHVLDADQRHLGNVKQGDARQLSSALGGLAGTVDLIATSPPYACDVGNVDKSAVQNHDKRLCKKETLNYSSDRANLGHARGDAYATEMLGIYQACFDALRPGGLLVTVTKNMRKHGRLVDLAGLTVDLTHQVGFRYLQHVVSLLCGVRDDRLVGRPSFWQQRQTTRARDNGYPLHLVAHEDVIVLAKPEAANV